MLFSPGFGDSTAEDGAGNELDATKKQSYFVSVKTVNLTIDEETWRSARIEAAKHNTSLSALVRGYLQAMVRGKAPIVLETSDDDDAEADRKSREELVKLFESIPFELGPMPTREERHERGSLSR